MCIRDSVKELRKFIQAGLAYKFTNSGDPGVILDFKHQAVHLILRHQLFLSLLRIHIHGTEFIDGKTASVFPNPGLLKYHRPRRLQIYCLLYTSH